MCDPGTLAIATATMTAAAGGMQAYSQYQEGSATNKYYQAQAKQAQEEASYAERIGERQSQAIQDTARFESKQFKSQAAQLQASQRAALVANGVDLSSATAEDIITSSFSKEKLDEALIRHNADVKSWEVKEDAKYKKWALENQARQYSVAGKSAKRAGALESFGTLLGTASSVAKIKLLESG